MECGQVWELVRSVPLIPPRALRGGLKSNGVMLTLAAGKQRSDYSESCRRLAG